MSQAQSAHASVSLSLCCPLVVSHTVPSPVNGSVSCPAWWKIGFALFKGTGGQRKTRPHTQHRRDVARSMSKDTPSVRRSRIPISYSSNVKLTPEAAAKNDTTEHLIIRVVHHHQIWKWRPPAPVSTGKTDESGRWWA